jgi:hypothetical protein
VGSGEVSTPPLPPGFELVDTPPLPAGFELVKPAAGTQPGGMGTPEVPSLAVKMGRGMYDVGQGLKQLYLMATDPEGAKKYTSDVNAEVGRYEAGRKAGGQDGIDWGRIGGSAVPGLLAAPAGMPASVAGRLGVGALMGAGQGAAEFNPEGTFSSKAVQSGLGAAGGLAGGAVIEGAAKLAAPVVSKVAQGAKALWNRATGAATDDAARAAVVNEIGQDAWNAMDAARQDGLVANAKRVLGSGRSLDAQALARKADIEAIGAKPTEAQITRDPGQFYWEQETSKLRGPGDKLQQSFVEQNRVLMDQLPGMRPAGASGDVYATSEGLRGGVQSFAKQSQADVSRAYTAAQEAEGRGDIINHKPFFNNVDQLLETHGDVIPPPVAQRIAELRQGTVEKSAPTIARQSVDTAKDDIVTAIRKLGGLNPDDERIGKAFVTGNPFNGNPRLGPVWTKPVAGGSQKGGVSKGLGLDDMTQALWDHGYVSDRNALDEVLDKLADTTMGTTHNSAYFDHAAANPDPLAASIEKLTEQLYQRQQPAQPTARSFTVQEAAKLYDLVTKRMTSAGDGQTRYAGGQIKQALADAFAQSPDTAGAAGTAFRDAVSKARERFGKLEPSAIANLADAKEAAPDYAVRMLTGSKPAELASLRDMVQGQQPEAWQNMRATALDWLQKKATMGDAEGKFSGKRFSDALDQIGNARLKVLFGPEELAQLGTIRRASYAMTREPPFANVNRSNTGSTLANLLSNGLVSPLAGLLSHVPVVGPMGAGAYQVGKNALANAATASRAASAANPGPNVGAGVPVSAQAAQRAMARYLMALGAPGAASAAQSPLRIDITGGNRTGGAP